jgi:hypothetical protein
MTPGIMQAIVAAASLVILLVAVWWATMWV